MVILEEKWLYSGKVVVFGQNGCIRAKVAVFGQKLLYSRTSGCTRAKVVVFLQIWLYSGKSGCFRARVFVFGKSGFIQKKVVVIGQMAVFWQK